MQSAEGYFNLAVYASRVGDDTRALEALNKAHEIDETDPDILHNRALIFRRLVSSTEGFHRFSINQDLSVQRRIVTKRLKKTMTPILIF